MLYTDDDTECVYPAQLFPNSLISYNKKEILKKVEARPNGVFIERNVRFTYYWMLLKDAEGKTIGVIGI